MSKERGIVTSTVLSVAVFDALRELAIKERRSVSNLIGIGVVEFLNRRKMGRKFEVPRTRTVMLNDPQFLRRVAKAVLQIEEEERKKNESEPATTTEEIKV